MIFVPFEDVVRFFNFILIMEVKVDRIYIYHKSSFSIITTINSKMENL